MPTHSSVKRQDLQSCCRKPPAFVTHIKWRVLWDLNPRTAFRPSPVFKTGAINHSTKHPMKVEEGVGFEPTDRLSPITCFRDKRDKPDSASLPKVAPLSVPKLVVRCCVNPTLSKLCKMVGTVGFEPTEDRLFLPSSDSKSPTLPSYVNAPIEKDFHEMGLSPSLFESSRYRL